MIPKNLSAVCAATTPTRNNLLWRLMIFAVVSGFSVFTLSHTSQVRAQSPQATGAPSPSFEVASIKLNRSGELRTGIRVQPGRFIANGITTKGLIAFGCNVKDFQISGGPSWITTARYDIDAKEEDADFEAMRNLPPDQRTAQLRLMVQSLLADRFKLKLGHESKELPVYALVIAKNGPKLQEAKPTDTPGIKGPDGRIVPGMGMMRMGGGEIMGQGIGMAGLATMLSQQLGRTVLDQTGLKGNYNITLKWTPDQSQQAMAMRPNAGQPATDNAPPPDSSGPSIFTAIEEQLGLKLESTKGPVEILVINQVEKPSED